ncbi:receptor-like protein Cf-9 homolog [Lycium barbarum]|uniref:receptor-like protein Cf-9 homolog n=1 Tax=Lycium barbarum TaxID=112863 RepID=UPI00293E802F|nr:receptor-like protein Cf-9 homolog [Lycium barbarum]
MWLGTLPKLQVLSLRSNKLHGPIRTLTIKNIFPLLRMLDLSSNAFTQNIPVWLLKAMRTIDHIMEAPIDEGDEYYEDSVAIVTKGLELQVVRILFLYTTIDLSNNKFEGHIPSVLGDLIALRVLNLSHNGLQGHIPSLLGNLSVVESLDLSCNHLSGEIPQQLASLTYLEFLNLSHNHLEGCIPQWNQLYIFENNSYEGNDGLRGFPVSKGCGNDHVSEKNYNVSALDDQESNSEFLNDFWKATLMGYGSGLCIGLSIIYFMVSTGNTK